MIDSKNYLNFNYRVTEWHATGLLLAFEEENRRKEGDAIDLFVDKIGVHQKNKRILKCAKFQRVRANGTFRTRSSSVLRAKNSKRFYKLKTGILYGLNRRKNKQKIKSN